MTHVKHCKIKILNKFYEIKCPEGEEMNLLLAADKLNTCMLLNKSKFKKQDDFNLLLLAALELGHELIACKNEQELHRQQVTRFISSMETKINKTVVGDADTIPQTD